jgi:hypothetical protein
VDSRRLVGGLCAFIAPQTAPEHDIVLDDPESRLLTGCG